VHEPLVGRAAELAELDRQFALAASGQGRTVLLTGPAGAGKTALIRRCLSAWAPDAGAVLASGDREEATMSGGLLGQLTQSGSPAAAEVTAVLTSGRPDPLRAGSALLAFLHEQASARPLVVVIDDAQWGDELSLKSLSFAIRRLQADQVLCLVAIRPADVPRLPSGITRAMAEHGVRLDLSGLDSSDVAALAALTGAGRLPRRAAQRLRDHTAGIPLHIMELLHDLPGDVLRTPGVSLPAPRSLEILVLSRLAACALETEQLVVAASVLGMDCPLADAAALAGLADPLPALQEAIEHRLLTEQETSGSRRCAFPHMLIRTAVYRDIGVSRRATLHRAAAGLTCDSAALAHRVAGCSGSDPQLAVLLARRATTDKSARLLAEAAEHLLMAARVAGRGPDADQYLLAAITLLIDLGDAARARSYAGEVSMLAPSALRSLVLGRLALVAGAYGAAEQWITDAWTLLEAEQGFLDQDEALEDAAKAACELALTLIGLDRLDDAGAWARRAAGAAVSGFTRACLCAVHGGCLAASGQASQAAAMLEAELLHCPDGAGRALLRAALGAVLLYADDLPSAARELEAAVMAEGDASLPMAHMLEAALLRVLVWYRSGQWDEAAAEGERLVALVDDLDQGWLLGRAHLAAVYVAAGRGCWETATGHAEAAASQPAARTGGGAIALADAKAAVAVAQDDPDGVLAAAGQFLTELGPLAHMEPGRLMYLAAGAEALARTGRHGQAETVQRWYEKRGRACGRRSAMAAASRARGVIDAERNCPQDALIAFDASLGYLSGLCMPMEEARTRLERGRLLRRLGQRRSAAREIGTARALFAALDARPFVAQCDSELVADLGSADLAAAASQAQPPLTPRQLAVARAAAAGKSNRAIAAELFISVKTVEFHIAQILARLSLDSRTQIAAALASHQ
jgi:DNA-binding CsgD family transcriptional regulator